MGSSAEEDVKQQLEGRVCERIRLCEHTRMRTRERRGRPMLDENRKVCFPHDDDDDQTQRQGSSDVPQAAIVCQTQGSRH